MNCLYLADLKSQLKFKNQYKQKQFPKVNGNFYNFTNSCTNSDISLTNYIMRFYLEFVILFNLQKQIQKQKK